MTFAEVVIKLWDKGGVPLLLLVGIFLIAKFGGARFVRSLDNVAQVQSQSIAEIARAVTSSSAAQVQALGGLTERVSRMEGQVVTLGQLAVRAAAPNAQESHRYAVQAVVEVFDEDGNTPISVPIPEQQPQPQAFPIPKRVNTPAMGSYALHARPSTKGGGGKSG